MGQGRDRNEKDRYDQKTAEEESATETDGASQSPTESRRQQETLWIQQDNKREKHDTLLMRPFARDQEPQNTDPACGNNEPDRHDSHQRRLSPHSRQQFRATPSDNPNTK
jgi:hypothetical protein